jgi:hypothetical protein
MLLLLLSCRPSSRTVSADSAWQANPDKASRLSVNTHPGAAQDTPALPQTATLPAM